MALALEKTASRSRYWLGISGVTAESGLSIEVEAHGYLRQRRWQTGDQESMLPPFHETTGSWVCNQGRPKTTGCCEEGRTRKLIDS